MWGFPEIQLRPNQLWQQMWIFHYFFFTDTMKQVLLQGSML